MVSTMACPLVRFVYPPFSILFFFLRPNLDTAAHLTFLYTLLLVLDSYIVVRFYFPFVDFIDIPSPIDIAYRRSNCRLIAAETDDIHHQFLELKLCFSLLQFLLFRSVHEIQALSNMAHSSIM